MRGLPTSRRVLPRSGLSWKLLAVSDVIRPQLKRLLIFLEKSAGTLAGSNGSRRKFQCGNDTNNLTPCSPTHELPMIARQLADPDQANTTVTDMPVSGRLAAPLEPGHRCRPRYAVCDL